MGESINDNLADTNSEAYRHKCEVSSVVRMYKEKGGDHVKKFLLLVEKHRGSEAATRLREAALAQVRLGAVGTKQQR